MVVYPAFNSGLPKFDSGLPLPRFHHGLFTRVGCVVVVAVAGQGGEGRTTDGAPFVFLPMVEKRQGM